MSRRTLGLIAITGLLVAACKNGKPEAPPPAPVAAPEAPKAAPPAEDVSASVSGTSDPACLGPLTAGAEDKAESVTLGKRAAKITGYRLTLDGTADADDQVVIGVLGSINEASGENLFNLDRYLKFFADKGVELVLVAGDTGEDRPDVEAVLQKLGKSGLPVVAYAGNRETRADFVDAVNAVHKAMPNVINGNRVREIDWDDATIFTLPGHHDLRYIHAGKNGCQYFTEDLAALGKAIAGAKGPVVLAAHTPPLGKAPTAVDVIATDRQHAGDPNLSRLLVDAKIPFGIFPNIKEAGGMATADVDGAKVVKEGEPSASLYLNPGAADSLEWTLNDGSSLSGSVAVLTVKGAQASYAMYKAPKLTDVEKGVAARMAMPAGDAGKATAKTE
jgi:hypothetical protein